MPAVLASAHRLHNGESPSVFAKPKLKVLAAEATALAVTLC